jgi:DNA repair exonuclease SbcCD ATPase subunit
VLRLKNLRFKNILSFGNMWTEINFEKSQNILIQGTNGAGKSSCILDTLCFGLYGKAFRKISKSKLINFKNRKDLVVEVGFIDDFGTEYYIKRGLSPQIFEIYKNGILINQDASVRDYQTVLEKNVLKIDFQSFTQMVILGKATYVAFLRLTTQDRRRFIEQVLALTIFSKMNEVNKSMTAAVKQAAELVKHDITLLNSKRELVSLHISDFESEASRMQQQHQESIDTEINQIANQINTLIVEKEQLELQIDESVVDEMELLQQRMETCSEFSTKIRTKLKATQKKKKFFKNNDMCPTCERQLDNHVKVAKTLEIESKEIELLDAQQALEIKTKEASDKVEAAHQRLETLRSLQQKVNVCNSNIQDRQKRITALEIKRNADLNFNIDLLLEKKEELALMEMEQQKKLDEWSALSEDATCHDFINTMLKDTGIKSAIIKRRIPKIQAIMNEYLRRLGLFVRFELNENFEETLYSRGIEPVAYQGFSEGEKLRIDLAMLMTWRELCKQQANMAVNFIVYDEILDASLDESGAECLVESFKILADEGTKVIVISHSAARWEDRFDECWVVKKVNGFSKISTNCQNEV